MPEYTIGAALFLAFIIVQRLSELVLAKRNTAKLLAKGAREYGAAHYPLIVGLHSCWIACLVFFGYGQTPHLFWLAIFVVLQIFRVWILATLGGRWTTRIIVLDEPLVRSGPFAYVRHPNYLLVIAEIFVTPMVLGLTWVAVAFTVLNGIVLWIRIRAEEEALGALLD
jgi:methyltransferase